MADRAIGRPGPGVRLDGRRVLLVLGTSAGGVGVHVRSLAAGLRERGMRVEVAAPASTQAVFGFADHVEVAVGGSPNPVRDARALRALRRASVRVDLVHAHGLRASALAVLASGPPVVSSWHNPGAGRTGAALERLVARRADVVLAASDDLAARARAAGARDVRPAPVAPPPPTLTGRDPGLGSPLVLAVGRLHPQKGYDVLVRALPHLGEAVVAVAGDGPLEAELRAAAPQVRWLGRRDDVGDLYAVADVVVLPSVWEARSLTAQEALRAGRPLVATAVGGLPGLVGDGAVLVPPGDPDALGRAVRRLLDDPVEAATLAARGRAVAATWPDEADAVAQAAALYAELLG
ncbi:MAG TPA: glycosyltransferase family 4 protein [Mycobacteriales bacterium]|nr:glycosyltransferase family 4 protein [Mycobacteriales bacterium]